MVEAGEEVLHLVPHDPCWSASPDKLNGLTVELVSDCWAPVLINVVLYLTVCLWTVTAPVSELGGNFSSGKTKHHNLSCLLDHWIQQSVTLKTKFCYVVYMIIPVKISWFKVHQKSNHKDIVTFVITVRKKTMLSEAIKKLTMYTFLVFCRINFLSCEPCYFFCINPFGYGGGPFQPPLNKNN